MPLLLLSSCSSPTCLLPITSCGGWYIVATSESSLFTIPVRRGRLEGCVFGPDGLRVNRRAYKGYIGRLESVRAEPRLSGVSEAVGDLLRSMPDIKSK
jgi:hypothetical protein